MADIGLGFGNAAASPCTVTLQYNALAPFFSNGNRKVNLILLLFKGVSLLAPRVQFPEDTCVCVNDLCNS